MSSAIVSPSSFDVSKISITPPKLLPSNARQSYLNYDGRSLTMQVGSLSVPYGMSVFDKAGPVKYSVDMSLRGYEGENPKVKGIFDAYTALDAYMIEQGVKNSKLWFKQEMSREIVKAFYTPCVRFSKDADGNPKPYPPSLKVTLRQRDGKFETIVYDDKKRPMTDVPMEDILVKGANITTLVQCTGVWFAGSKYGLSWKAVQIRVDSLPDSIRGYAIADDDDEEVVKRPATQKAAAPVAAKSNGFQAFAEAEEEDDEVDDEAVFSKPVAAPAARAAPAPVEMDDDEDDVAPVALPKKPTTVKKIVKSVVKKA